MILKMKWGVGKRMDRVKAFMHKYRDMIVYLIFGILTTVVDYLVFIPCYQWLGFTATLSNIIAWTAAVTFAYLTNKPFVFRNYDWSRKTVISELTKFIGCRIGTGAIETTVLFISVDMLHWHGVLMKVVASVMVVSVNYFASKWLIFKKNA